ncbi:hypothetical protein Rhe02_48680 [Rhizocola hellebori]|uniref:LPXTG cell wall anchor domain-containing protein n=1 Tax=Rhizocola hellebori TaxID=1392758 RepID=A0A8J3QC67_9ACTN|nr:LPXTG cell wall anchor domain-containing protein [Rhizocola hellebori]GIH06801.1 hypothetical protein Rhe02_48680 [Rhizocola hellebori]
MRVGRIIVVTAIVALSSAFAGSAAQAMRPWPSPSTNGGTGGGPANNWTKTTAPPTTPPAPLPSGGADTGGGGSNGVAFAGIGALAVAGGAGIVLFRNRRRDEFV